MLRLLTAFMAFCYSTALFAHIPSARQTVDTGTIESDLSDTFDELTDQAYDLMDTVSPDDEESVIQRRLSAEARAGESRYIIKTYRPNYIIPFYYTGSPYFDVYDGSIPDDQTLQHTEFKFQVSLRMPLVNELFGDPRYSIQAAYTQKAYWQLYTDSAWFRETNYEPEIFLATNPHPNWLINYGVNHQSNGRGGDLERSWNRAFIDVAVAGEKWTLAVRAWTLIFKDVSTEIYNPDIADYLGHEKILGAYKLGESTFSLSVQNIERINQGAWEATWSHPITRNLSLYVQGFMGYGQSMIEYDHYTNSIGIGLTVNDWI